MEPSRIVAVASSARDPHPVLELLSAFPAPFWEAFVIVQYPESGLRDLSLVETLKQRMNLPIIEVRDDLVPERGHVYTNGANTRLTIIGERISVTPGVKGPHPPGDTLFVSLAEQRGKRAMGVVLSGGGSDGTLGVRALRNCGGVTFAQYPGTARYPSMPISAIETGCVDFVLPPNEIAHEIRRSLNPTAAMPSPFSLQRTTLNGGVRVSALSAKGPDWCTQSGPEDGVEGSRPFLPALTSKTDLITSS